MDEGQLRIEIRNEFHQTLPKNIVEANKEQVEQQIQKVVSFIIKFSENEYFAYMKSRQDNISIEEHLSKIPCGINKFEEWFNGGLLVFAKEILFSLDTKMEANIHFARLFDNRDYDAFIINSKIKDTDIEQWKLLLEPIFQISETPYLTQAFACINLSLDNAALSLLNQWIQSLWFDDQSVKKVFDDARKIEAIRNEHAKAGKKGAIPRWEAKVKTEKYAIELMLQGNYKNASHATAEISADVIKFGKTIGWIFSNNIYQAPKTIYNWLRKYIKQENYNF